MRAGKFFLNVVLTGLMAQAGFRGMAQCNIDTPNTQVGFTPSASAPVVNGTATFQTAQMYVMPSVTIQSATAIVDSLVFTAVNGLPAGVTYSFNPASATIRGGGNGALCFTGTPTSGGGNYPLSYTGIAYTNFGAIPFSNVPGFNSFFHYTFQVLGPPVAAFSATQFCVNDTITFIDLSVAHPSDTSWRWTFTEAMPHAAQMSNPQVVYQTAGTYQVKLVVTNPYGTDSLTKNILIGAQPTATVATTPASGTGMANGTATVTILSGIPPYSINWSQGGDSSTATGLLPGIYNLVLYDSLGCKYVNDSVVINISAGIIQLAGKQQVKIYPNPAAGFLNLAWSLPSNAEITVLDLQGNVVWRNTSTGKTIDVFDVHTLTPGTYILNVTDKANNQQRAMLFSKF